MCMAIFTPVLNINQFSTNLPLNSGLSVEFYIISFSAYDTGRLSDSGNLKNLNLIWFFKFLNLKNFRFFYKYETSTEWVLNVLISFKVILWSSRSFFSEWVPSFIPGFCFSQTSILAYLSAVWDFPCLLSIFPSLVFWDYTWIFVFLIHKHGQFSGLLSTFLDQFSAVLVPVRL